MLIVSHHPPWHISFGWQHGLEYLHKKHSKAPSGTEPSSFCGTVELSESDVKVNGMVASFKEFMVGLLGSSSSDLERETVVTLCMNELEGMRTRSKKKEALNVGKINLTLMTLIQRVFMRIQTRVLIGKHSE